MADKDPKDLGRYTPRREDRIAPEEEDPLVELARIVSDDGGFYKTPGPEVPVASPDQTDQTEPYSQDLEAELTREMALSDPQTGAGPETVAPETDYAPSPEYHEEPGGGEGAYETDPDIVEGGFEPGGDTLRGILTADFGDENDHQDPQVEQYAPGDAADDPYPPDPSVPDTGESYAVEDHQTYDPAPPATAEYAADDQPGTLEHPEAYPEDEQPAGAAPEEYWPEIEEAAAVPPQPAPPQQPAPVAQQDYYEEPANLDDELERGLAEASSYDEPEFTVETPGEIADPADTLESEYYRPSVPELEDDSDLYATEPEPLVYADDPDLLEEGDPQLAHTPLEDDEDFPDFAAAAGPRVRIGADEERPQRSRALMFLTAAVLAVVIIGGGIAVTIGLTGRGAEESGPIVIRADNSEIKVVPDDAQASSGSANGQAVFETVSGQTGKSEEKLIDRTEEPKELGRISVPGAGEATLSADGGESEPLKIEARMNDQTETARNGPTFDPIGPRKVRTVVIKPDGTIVDEPASSASVSPALGSASNGQSQLSTGGSPSEQQVSDINVSVPTDSVPKPVKVQTIRLNDSGAPVVMESAGTPLTGGATTELTPASPKPAMETEIASLDSPQQRESEAPEPAAMAPVGAAPLPAAPLPKERPAPAPAVVARAADNPAASRPANNSDPVNLLAAAPAEPQAAPAEPQAPATPRRAAPAATISTSGYLVQVSSQRSREQALSTYTSLQRRFPSLLGGYEASIQQAEIAGKGTYFRVRVGPFQSRSDAVGLCDQLKSSGGACFVTR